MTEVAASRAESKTKVVAKKCLGKTVEDEKKAFVDVAREPARRIGDALWLQFGGRELRGREDVLGRCLVGRWGFGLVVEWEMASFRKWGERFWNLKKGMKVLKLGGAFFLLEFEDEEEAERVFLASCWSGEVFKKISDCYGVQLLWEVLPWNSAVVPMNKLKGREGEKVREEWDVGSRAGSNGGMGKDIRCAAKIDGAGFGKGNREKGSEGVGLSEKGGSTAFNGFKLVCVDAQAQGNTGLFHEGPTNLLSSRMGCALKENERSGPKSFWEAGLSSKGVERVLYPENERRGPKSFWEAGQSIKGAERVSNPDWAFLDEPLKKGRASIFRMLSKEWFVEEFLVSKMSFEEIEGVSGSFSPADACLMGEASRYSFFSPSFVCVWGQDSSSSPFSGVDGALITVEEGHDAVVILKKNERELSVNPLSV
ncbi:hypothetical protein CK203_054450 [Vitis vinifera]|uniref:DUF4283 domain-containing protein n=1 Tax=Vitis vinifera TaxID=29760 RepID=A0A438GZU2_VITVI|nr:hypothetical protein CK203_054450 [Vitis vinifera]